MHFPKAQFSVGRCTNVRQPMVPGQPTEGLQRRFNQRHRRLGDENFQCMIRTTDTGHSNLSAARGKTHYTTTILMNLLDIDRNKGATQIPCDNITAGQGRYEQSVAVGPVSRHQWKHRGLYGHDCLFAAHVIQVHDTFE